MASRDSRERAARFLSSGAPPGTVARVAAWVAGRGDVEIAPLVDLADLASAFDAIRADLARDTAAQVRAAWIAGRDAAAEVCWGRATGHGGWSSVRGEATKCENAIRALTPPGEATGEKEKDDAD